VDRPQHQEFYPLYLPAVRVWDVVHVRVQLEKLPVSFQRSARALRDEFPHPGQRGDGLTAVVAQGLCQVGSGVGVDGEDVPSPLGEQVR